ncbi:MAG: tetratricopeptide repeat protein [Verrucomicrobiia bacterium]
MAGATVTTSLRNFAPCLERGTMWVRLAAVALPLAFVAVRTAEAQFSQHDMAARSALAKGDDAKAKRELKLSLQSNPLDADAHLLLALLLAKEGDLDQAVAGLQQSLKLEPNNPVARYNLGTAMLRRGQPVAAAEQLETGVLLRPDHIPSYNNLAKAYFLAGLPELTVATYREVLRRAPSNSVALRNLELLKETASGPASSRNPLEAVWPLASASRTDEPAFPGEVPASSTPGQPTLDHPEADLLRRILVDLPHVNVEPFGGRLALTGWTSDLKERKLLDRVLAARQDLLDLTTEDTGDGHRLLEVDAILFVVLGAESQSVGHNFLQQIEFTASVADASLSSFSWLYEAAINYQVNIANALETRVALLARPHLTTLSGTPATFRAGGDVVFRVAGTTSGDIKPYPFGTKLQVTPTLLRTRGENGSPRVRLAVNAERKTILPLGSLEVEAAKEAVVFDEVTVTSEAVLDLDQTLILTGLNQREQRTLRSGVPGLKSIPIIKYLFSTKVTATSDLAIIILLTPRDPAFRNDQNRLALEHFVEKRLAYIEASKGTEEDRRRFRERYPDWDKLVPNRFASHFFLMNSSEVYRRFSGMDLADESLDFDLLGTESQKKAKR